MFLITSKLKLPGIVSVISCKRILKVPVYLQKVFLNKSDSDFPLCASNAEYPGVRWESCDSHLLSSIPFEPNCQAGCALLKDVLLLAVSVLQAWAEGPAGAGDRSCSHGLLPSRENLQPFLRIPGWQVL